MNGISQNAETLWDQNDPCPCLKGKLNPSSSLLKKKCNLMKKAMEKVRFEPDSRYITCQLQGPLLIEAIWIYSQCKVNHL